MPNTKCYICDCEITEDNKSKEHIIPNELGGRLSSDNLLCRSCNNKFSDEFEREFVHYFDSIKERINLARERNNPKGIKTKIDLLIGEVEVIFKDNKIKPTKPYFINELNKTIYFFNADMPTDVPKVLQSIIKRNRSYSKYHHEILTKSINQMYGHINFKFEINDYNVLSKGLNKIAINFAISKGILKEEINIIKDNKILPQTALHYYPISKFEQILEENRNIIDAEYPNHTLILQTQKYITEKKEHKNALLCFIDLFSTFQFFILLNNDFKDKYIYETYYQSLIKKDFDKEPYQKKEYASELQEVINNFTDIISLRSAISLKDKQFELFKNDQVFQIICKYEHEFIVSMLEEIFKYLLIPTEEGEDIIIFENFRHSYYNLKSKKIESTYFTNLNLNQDPEHQKKVQEYMYNKHIDIGKFPSPETSLALGHYGEVQEKTSIFRIKDISDEDIDIEDLPTGIIISVEKNKIFNQQKLMTSNLIQATIYSKLDRYGRSSLWHFKTIKKLNP